MRRVRIVLAGVVICLLSSFAAAQTTLWEIHPITKIEVFRNGQWQPF